jgi:hypothetical protein
MFTSEQKIFIVQCYFRNGESSYSTPLVFEEFQQKFPDFHGTYYAGQKILAVIVCQFKKKKIVIRTLLSS